jgi:hypothetical protein
MSAGQLLASIPEGDHLGMRLAILWLGVSLLDVEEMVAARGVVVSLARKLSGAGAISSASVCRWPQETPRS